MQPVSDQLLGGFLKKEKTARGAAWGTRQGVAEHGVLGDWRLCCEGRIRDLGAAEFGSWKWQNSGH